MEFSLSSFLQNFISTNTPFAIMEGRIYTIHSINPEECSLEESEELSVLEEELLRKNKQPIEKYMSWIIESRFLRKLRENQQDITKLENLYSSQKDNLIEKFIKFDVFNAYNHENINLKEEIQSKELNTNLDFISIDDLFSKPSNLEQMLKYNNFVILNNKCFVLSEKNNKHKYHFSFKGKKFFPKHISSLQNMEKEYQNFLLSKIKSTALEHGKKFSKILKEQQKIKTNLETNISQNFNKKRGEIGFKKLRDSEYLVFIDIPPFIIKNGRFYYKFNYAKLGTVLKFTSNNGKTNQFPNTLSRILDSPYILRRDYSDDPPKIPKSQYTIEIKHAPRILNTPYSHPYVYSDGTICYGTLNWRRHFDIEFNHKYPLFKDTLAKKISDALKQGKRNLEVGSVGIDEERPVRHINSMEPIARSPISAERYARQNNIPKERIFDNNPKK